MRLIEVGMHLIECTPRHDLATGWECQMTKEGGMDSRSCSILTKFGCLNWASSCQINFFFPLLNKPNVRKEV